MAGIPETKTPLRYWRMNPTGNITLLVEGDGMPENAPFAALAEDVMKEEPGAEQVGFVFFEDDAARAAGAHLRLRMAGGEFCGNATLSAAALYAMKQEMDQGKVRVLVSGADAPVMVEISRETGGPRYSGRVHMPLPESVEEVQLSTETADSQPEIRAFSVVRFAGISHVILDTENVTLTREAAQRLAPLWCKTLGADALGLMFIDVRAGRLDPLVYVPEADTLFWESSCASGTTAVGAWMFSKTKEAVSLSLSQPGGVLRVSADQKSLILGGCVCAEKHVQPLEKE